MLWRNPKKLSIYLVYAFLELQLFLKLFSMETNNFNTTPVRKT